MTNPAKSFPKNSFIIKCTPETGQQKFSKSYELDRGKYLGLELNPGNRTGRDFETLTTGQDGK